MKLIGSFAGFPSPEAIYLINLLNPPTIPKVFQKLLVPFTNWSIKEQGQKFLKYLNCVKDIPQTYRNKERWVLKET